MKGDKLIELVVQRGTTDALVGIVDLDLYLAFLHHHGHDTLVVHIKACHTDCIQQARETELAVNHVAGIDVLQFLILDGLQI